MEFRSSTRSRKWERRVLDTVFLARFLSIYVLSMSWSKFFDGPCCQHCQASGKKANVSSSKACALPHSYERRGGANAFIIFMGPEGLRLPCDANSASFAAGDRDCVRATRRMAGACRCSASQLRIETLSAIGRHARDYHLLQSGTQRTSVLPSHVLLAEARNNCGHFAMELCRRLEAVTSAFNAKYKSVETSSVQSHHAAKYALYTTPHHGPKQSSTSSEQSLQMR